MRNHHSQSVPSSNLAWEKSRHFATPPKWRLRNDCKNSILITCHFPDLNSSSDWLRQSSLAAQPIRSTWSQIQASDTSSVCSYFSDVFSGHEEKQHSSMFVLRMWAQQIHRTDLRGAWEREEKEVATKSYWRGNGIVSPLEFGTHELFLSNLADKPSRKNGESYASAISWLRTRRSFEILRSVHTCVRGSRTFFHKNSDFLDDFSVIKCKRCGHF